MNSKANIDLSRSLEDYLETIYELVRDNKVARVKEIAKLRGVKPGSVSPAMKRLAELKLIKYEQREYIDLTPLGEQEARRIYARHSLLSRFFEEILGLDRESAQRDACAMEHSLSDEGMDRFALFFEFIKTFPHAEPDFLLRFRDYAQPGCRGKKQGKKSTKDLNLTTLPPGQQAIVTRVLATDPMRGRLLDMGILPDARIRVVRVTQTGSPIWVSLQGFEVSLERREAAAVLVSIAKDE
jgi:DtxR family transcriptional regulator, Mn-dependent transcriptional regulator